MGRFEVVWSEKTAATIYPGSIQNRLRKRTLVQL